ncbi:Hypothetical Protein FCC1311_019972 [Hondaea fermentalgiana]|uniref:Uncharacterized protein n=1 Tax=Hondaea fermentalgiana TaxID=2315210 RepID=A0A2R5G7K6_9STRA|nr:Hypothetical Protein FCC1311_019972 [Hondaea fermentalgiana]|eukprot:GBG25778.1 Hypothetical Protein FCC1311_019972 [Hondaea fermentalgiana]
MMLLARRAVLTSRLASAGARGGRGRLLATDSRVQQGQAAKHAAAAPEAAAQGAGSGANATGAKPRKNSSGMSASDVAIMLVLCGGSTVYLVNEVKDMEPIQPKGAKNKAKPSPPPADASADAPEAPKSA